MPPPLAVPTSTSSSNTNVEDDRERMETVNESKVITQDASNEEKGSLEVEGKDGAGPAFDFPVLSTFQSVMLIGTMTCAMILNIMQVQSIVLTLEHIGKDLHISIPNYQWLSSSYALSFGGLLLLFGRIADLFGHKRVFLMGMSWFCIWSVAVGVAPNEISIDLFRALQGAGAGAAIPSALGILGSSFAPSQLKSTAFATFAAGAPIGGVFGGVLGGIFAQYATWRAVFWFSAGFALMLVVCGYFFIPPDRKRHLDEDRSIDWIGAALVTSGLVLATFALADGSSAAKGWKTPYIPALLVVGVILLATFWFWERHLEYSTNKKPLMRTSLWFKGRFAAVQLLACLGWSGFSSFMFFSIQYLQTYSELPPILATVRFLPSTVTGVILNIVVALVAHLVPAQILLMLGGLGTGLAPVLFAIQKVTAPYWEYQFPAFILTVFGADFVFATGIMYVSKVAGPGEQALAGGVFNMVTQVGTSIGLAIMSLIQSEVTRAETERLGFVYDPNSNNMPKAAILKGFRAVFWGCAAFPFAAMVVAATCCWGIGKVGHKAPKPQAVEEEVKIGGKLASLEESS
ncbi:putative efflux transporter [Meredithblackwellia eburnea MCA 4105]